MEASKFVGFRYQNTCLLQTPCPRLHTWTWNHSTLVSMSASFFTHPLCQRACLFPLLPSKPVRSGTNRSPSCNGEGRRAKCEVLQLHVKPHELCVTRPFTLIGQFLSQISVSIAWLHITTNTCWVELPAGHRTRIRTPAIPLTSQSNPHHEVVCVLRVNFNARIVHPTIRQLTIPPWPKYTPPP